jgi:hypothetical protein
VLGRRALVVVMLLYENVAFGVHEDFGGSTFAGVKSSQPPTQLRKERARVSRIGKAVLHTRWLGCRLLDKPPERGGAPSLAAKKYSAPHGLEENNHIRRVVKRERADVEKVGHIARMRGMADLPC